MSMPGLSIAFAPEIVARAFPFHLALDSELCIVQIGAVLQRVCPTLVLGQPFGTSFRIKRPQGVATFAAIAEHPDTLFILEALTTPLMLKGQMIVLPDCEAIVFVGSPWLTTLEQVTQLGLSAGDFAIHDPVADYLFLLQAKNMALAELNELAQQLEHQRAQLRAQNQQLQDSERRYRSVVDTVREVVFQVDTVGRLQFLNRAWTEITEHAVEDSVGQSLADFIHPDDRPEAAERLQVLLQREKSFCRYELRLLTKSGQPRWVEVCARLAVGDAGASAAIAGTFSDITERRLAIEALHASESRFQAFMNNSPTMTYIKDADGRLIYVNHRMLRHFDAQPDDLLGKTYMELMPAEFAAPLHEHDQQALLSADTVRLEELVPRPRRRPSTWLSFRFPLAERDGQRVLACIAIDITERKYYEQQLEEYQLRLEGAITQMERLAHTDLLTGINNRGAFQKQIEDEIDRARRYRLPLSLIMLDVDHFKKFNDSFGHPAGDDVLKRVAQLLQRQVRQNDHVARYGGEEFVILLINMPSQGAYIMAERIRRSIETAEWTQRPITASVGVSTFDWDEMDSTAFITAADRALYQAKSNGRNQVFQVEPQAYA